MAPCGSRGASRGGGGEKKEGGQTQQAKAPPKPISPLSRPFAHGTLRFAPMLEKPMLEKRLGAGECLRAPGQSKSHPAQTNICPAFARASLRNLRCNTAN